MKKAIKITTENAEKINEMIAKEEGTGACNRGPF